jgi:GAF domain-containing protein/anti-sigma regulatory factor (Ser/Thr protein kinase)
MLLEQVAVASPLPEMLAGLVRLIEEHSRDGLIGSVLLTDSDGTRLRFAAAPSLPDWYNAAVDGVAIGPASGSCGTAAYRREPVIVVDVESDPLWESFRELARSAGLRACWSTPLISRGEVLGTFAMYYPEPRQPSDEDLQLAHLFSRTAALAIERDRQERGRLAAVAAEGEYARRFSRLADVSLEFAAAETIDRLVEVVISRGVAILGADGGALTVRDDEHGVVHLSVSAELDEQVPIAYAQIPLDSRIPGAYVARTGETVLFPDKASGLAWSEEMVPVYEATGRNAWATLPLSVGGRILGALVVSWVEERSFTRGDLELMQGLAAQCAQSLHRIQTQAAQRDAAATAQRMSEAFQRSLLTRPPHPDDVALAVRYLPAVEQAQVGGDWYDAFPTAWGATTLVIGDVTGHDRDAAAAMGQVRNILRGLAYDSHQSPAALLRRLDAALHGLELGVMATAVLVQSLPPEPGAAGVRLRWSNAGHLPPLLRHADGQVDILDTEPDLLLGLSGGSGRQDSMVELPDGVTFLLYTDGLVERRDEHLDDGIRRLADALSDLGDLPLEQLCTALTERLQPSGEDDVALLAIRPRGPARDPNPGAAMAAELVSTSVPVAFDPAAVSRARRVVAQVCTDAGISGDARDVAVLLTSELVTNAVLHAATSARLTVAVGPDRVRVEVADSDGTLPQPRQADEEAIGGRGLAMVALLAARWGADRTDRGKAVWFELAC